MNQRHTSIILDQLSKIIAGHEQVARWKTNAQKGPSLQTRRADKDPLRVSKPRLIRSKSEVVCWRLARWVVLGKMALCLTAIPAAALDPGLPPGGNFDLTHWKLSMPSHPGTEIVAAQLEGGFTN